MNNFSNSNNNTSATKSYGDSLSRTFVSNVFSWMALALIVSSVFAFYFGNSAEMLSYIYNSAGGMTIFGYISIFAPFILVMIMGIRYQKLSYGVLVIFFGLFSALMGISLASIFVVYKLSSIASVFGITAGTFGAMALLGYTTKTDLTRFGSILYMALFGIIIASIANYFMQSAQMDYIISIIGVLIFTGLTAYDVQKIKRIGQGLEYADVSSNKLAIMGALSLYLDFINLFLFMLRIFGNRK